MDTCPRCCQCDPELGEAALSFWAGERVVLLPCCYPVPTRPPATTLTLGRVTAALVLRWWTGVLQTCDDWQASFEPPRPHLEDGTTLISVLPKILWFPGNHVRMHQG